MRSYHTKFKAVSASSVSATSSKTSIFNKHIIIVNNNNLSLSLQQTQQTQSRRSLFACAVTNQQDNISSEHYKIREDRLPTAAENAALRELNAHLIHNPNMIEQTEVQVDKDCIVKLQRNPNSNTVQTKNSSPLFRNSFKEDLYPSHPHNFTPLKSEYIQPGFGSLDRAIRDIPWESRFELMQRKVTPKYCSEVRGTPRNAYQEGMVEGCRVRPVFNPYVELTAKKRYVLDLWPSRNWQEFDNNTNGNGNNNRFHVRGGHKSYSLPRDIAPTKDELGEWHPPRLSGRYKGDIEKQFYAHNLPWVWKNNFYNPVQHFMDRTPKGPKRWYKKEYRNLRIAEALRKMPELTEEYRRERRAAKRLSWFEKSMVDLMGKGVTDGFIRKQVLPKF